VDGVIIPYGLSETVPNSAMVALNGPDPQDEQLNRINPSHGQLLLDLACELVWATGWEDEANDVISPRLGLPHLPVVPWGEDMITAPGRLHWKTRDIIAFAEGRPFIWIDDEIGDLDQEWVRAHHLAPALLHRIEPHMGLTEDDIIEIDGWLTTVTAND
jgi:hypothetical protein